MAGVRYEFETELFRWEARRDLWVFARLPDDISEEIRLQPHPPAGWGSVKVMVTLGGSRWSTSVPTTRAGTPARGAPLRLGATRARAG